MKLPLLYSLLTLVMMSGGTAIAGTIVSSDVETVSVTVYRDAQRASGGINSNWPGGYALITETRAIDLPSGESTVRFEGVAEGLLPETAILSGTPEGVTEKNRDARLLSPAGLVDAYLKRSVTLTRTDRKTGKVTTQDAIVTAGPNGGVILKTAAGYEALGCSGLPERMTYAEVPERLSARPTLSVILRSSEARRVSLQLTYLAEGFDWAANYVADRSPESGRLDMLGWITVNNGGVTSFPSAQLNVIAGQPNRDNRRHNVRAVGGPLRLDCWPMDVTSTHPSWGLSPLQNSAQDGGSFGSRESIVLTARSRSEVSFAPMPAPAMAMVAEQEDVGDLKFYRVPVKVDVSAQGQKQVAFFTKQDVKAEQLYVASVGDGASGAGSRGMTLRLRVLNKESEGLGQPMPAGGVAVFDNIDGVRVLVGEADIGDKAKDERIDYDISTSSSVRIQAEELERKGAKQNWIVTLSNAHAWPVKAEVTISHALTDRPKGMERRGNAWIWRVDVPANGKRDLHYSEKIGCQ